MPSRKNNPDYNNINYLVIASHIFGGGLCLQMCWEKQQPLQENDDFRKNLDPYPHTLRQFCSAAAGSRKQHMQVHLQLAWPSFSSG